MSNIFLYKKPSQICELPDKWNKHFESGSFVNSYKQYIKDTIKTQGLCLRLAVNDDILAVDELIKRCYPPAALRDSNPYDYYRFITYGHGLIVETNEKKVIGCLFEEGYDTPDRTSYSLRLAIDDTIKTKDIGTLMVEYSTLLALERGSKIKRGLLVTDTFISAHILINKLGWICESFHADMKWIAPSFVINIPLTIEQFAYNRIDMDRLINHLTTIKEGTDFRLVDYNDFTGLEELFTKNDFIISAMLWPGAFNNNVHKYVAFPTEQLALGGL